MKSAIFPGTFDPITNGHIEILKKALKIFDKIYVVILDNNAKKVMFNSDDRKVMIEESISKLDNVEVKVFKNKMIIDVANDLNVKYIIRGVRNINDFTIEIDRANTVKKFEDDIETVLFPSNTNEINISSTIVREIISVGGDPQRLLPFKYIKKVS